MKCEYELWKSNNLHVSENGYISLLIFKQKHYLTFDSEWNIDFIEEIEESFASYIKNSPFFNMERSYPLERYYKKETLFSLVKDLAGLLYILNKGEA